MDEAIKRINKCIEKNKNCLDISNLNLTKLPDNLPAFIQELNCHGNRIMKLPDNLPTSLQKLDCSFNQITHLPYNLPALDIFWCHNNQITKLPDNLNAGDNYDPAYFLIIFRLKVIRITIMVLFTFLYNLILKIFLISLI